MISVTLNDEAPDMLGGETGAHNAAGDTEDDLISTTESITSTSACQLREKADNVRFLIEECDELEANHARLLDHHLDVLLFGNHPEQKCFLERAIRFHMDRIDGLRARRRGLESLIQGR